MTDHQAIFRFDRWGLHITLTVRGALAFAIVTGAIAGACSWDVAGMVTAFYFGSRFAEGSAKKADTGDSEPSGGPKS